jgi:hypothetical protein
MSHIIEMWRYGRLMAAGVVTEQASYRMAGVSSLLHSVIVYAVTPRVFISVTTCS